MTPIQYLIVGEPLGDSAASMPEDTRRLIWNAGVGALITLDLDPQVASDLIARACLLVWTGASSGGGGDSTLSVDQQTNLAAMLDWARVNGFQPDPPPPVWPGVPGGPGPVGNQGPQGAQGAPGVQGPPGPPGPQGVFGPANITPGPQGPQGDMGLQGPIGPDGPPGPEGPQGDPGTTGADGATGPQGPVGPDGTPGQSFNYKGQWTTGKTYSTRDVVLGSDENSYIAVSGSQNVDPTTDTAQVDWAPFIIHGAQGPAGPSGPTGDTGPVGPSGGQGAQGVQGPKGDTGATGPQGAQGNIGATGAQGPAGAQGPKGDTGAQGLAGATGAQGVQGPQGAIGPQGPMPTVQRGSSSVAFTASSNNSGTVTVNHTFGSTGYTALLSQTTLYACTLVVSNKTATNFQVQGIAPAKAVQTVNFDWTVL